MRTDFWRLPEAEQSSRVADRIETNYYLRTAPEKRPRHLQDLDSAAPTSARPATDSSDYSEKADSLEKGHAAASEPAATPAVKAKKYDESMFKALHNTFAREMWFAGVLKLFADTLKTTTPLVTRVLLNWVTDSYVYHRLPEAARAERSAPQGIGYGIGLAFAIFAMQGTLKVNFPCIRLLTCRLYRTFEFAHEPLHANHDEIRSSHSLWSYCCHLPQSSSYFWQRSLRTQRWTNYNDDFD